MRSPKAGQPASAIARAGCATVQDSIENFGDFEYGAVGHCLGVLPEFFEILRLQ
jgi:hypothetical protein